MRDPKPSDVQLWQSVTEKIAAARRALDDADRELGMLIPTLSDDTALAVADKLGAVLCDAIDAAARLEAPIQGQWAGGDRDVPGTGEKLKWRYV